MRDSFVHWLNRVNSFFVLLELILFAYAAGTTLAVLRAGEPTAPRMVIAVLGFGGLGYLLSFWCGWCVAHRLFGWYPADAPQWFHNGAFPIIRAVDLIYYQLSPVYPIAGGVSASWILIWWWARRSLRLRLRDFIGG